MCVDIVRVATRILERSAGALGSHPHPPPPPWNVRVTNGLHWSALVAGLRAREPSLLWATHFNCVCAT